LEIKRCFKRISCAYFVVGFTLLGELRRQKRFNAKGAE